MAGIKDPWARREAWRYTGQFTRRNRFKGSLSGLGLGTTAFVIYCLYEKFLMKPSHH